MKVLFLLSLRLNSDETRVDGEIWVGKCKCIKDSWAIKFGYLMVPRGPSPMPDLGILLYEVPIKCGCFGHINYMLLFYSASQTIFFSYRICKKIHAEWGVRIYFMQSSGCRVRPWRIQLRTVNFADAHVEAWHEGLSDPNSTESGGAFFSNGSFPLTRSHLTAPWTCL